MKAINAFCGNLLLSGDREKQQRWTVRTDQRLCLLLVQFRRLSWAHYGALALRPGTAVR